MDSKERIMKLRYNISLSEKEEMISNQNNLCGCCGEPLGENTRNFHLDHCHESGQIRKILCRACNLSLGLMKENPNKIKKLLDYSKYCQELRKPNVYKK